MDFAWLGSSSSASVRRQQRLGMERASTTAIMSQRRDRYNIHSPPATITKHLLAALANFSRLPNSPRLTKHQGAQARRFTAHICSQTLFKRSVLLINRQRYVLASRTLAKPGPVSLQFQSFQRPRGPTRALPFLASTSLWTKINPTAD